MERSGDLAAGFDPFGRCLALPDRPEAEVASPGCGGSGGEDELVVRSVGAGDPQDLEARQQAAGREPGAGHDLLDVPSRGAHGLADKPRAGDPPLPPPGPPRPRGGAPPPPGPGG